MDRETADPWGTAMSLAAFIVETAWSDPFTRESR